jgi:hypothetical protein
MYMEANRKNLQARPKIQKKLLENQIKTKFLPKKYPLFLKSVKKTKFRMEATRWNSPREPEKQ